MVSYQVGSVCYSTPLAAVQAMAAKEVGSVVQIGTATYVVNSTGQTASSITYVLQNVSSAAVVTTTETVTPLPCGLLDTADGLLISWGIAACWLAVAGILFIRRGLHE